MTRKDYVAGSSYISPELSVLNFETAFSYLQSVSINDMDIYPQVDEYVQEGATEIEF